MRAKCTVASLLLCSDAATEAEEQHERRETMRKIQHFFLAFLQVASGAGLKLCVSMLVKIKDFGLARAPNPKNFLASQGREVTGCKFSLFRNEAVSGAPIGSETARSPRRFDCPRWLAPGGGTAIAEAVALAVAVAEVNDTHAEHH